MTKVDLVGKMAEVAAISKAAAEKAFSGALDAIEQAYIPEKKSRWLDSARPASRSERFSAAAVFTSWSTRGS